MAANAIYARLGGGKKVAQAKDRAFKPDPTPGGDSTAASSPLLPPAPPRSLPPLPDKTDAQIAQERAKLLDDVIKSKEKPTISGTAGTEGPPSLPPMRSAEATEPPAAPALPSGPSHPALATSQSIDPIGRGISGGDGILAQRTGRDSSPRSSGAGSPAAIAGARPRENLSPENSHANNPGTLLAQNNGAFHGETFVDPFGGPPKRDGTDFPQGPGDEQTRPSTSPAAGTPATPPSTSPAAGTPATPSAADITELLTTQSDTNASKSKTESINRDRASASEKGATTGSFTPGASNVSADKDSCEVSENLGGYGCSGVRTFIDGSKVLTQVTNTLGAAGVNAMGTNSLANSNSQSLADNMKAAAKTQETAAKAQMASGLLSVGIGAVEIGMKFQKDQNARKLIRGTSGETVDGQLNIVNQRDDNLSDADMRSDGRNSTLHGFVKSEKGTMTDNAMQKYKLQGTLNFKPTATLKMIDTAKNEEGRLKTKADTARSEANAAAAEAQNAPQANAGALRARALALNQRAEAAKETYEAQVERRKDLENTRTEEIQHRQNLAKSKKEEITNQIGGLGKTAASEQKAVGNEAMSAGILSLLTGAGQIGQGYLTMKGAQEARKAADKLAQGVPGPTFSPKGPGDFFPPDDGAPRTPTSITPGNTGSADGAAAVSENLGGLGDDPLGAPLPGAVNDPLAGTGPIPGKAIPGQGNPGGGGGVGNLGGSSTSPTQNTGEGEAGARAADNRLPAYEGGGSFRGGGAGGSGAGAGPDLSSLLAKLLPQDKEDGANANIMDFGGDRGVAGNDDGALLDKNVNIFKRIHEFYQTRQKEKKI